VSEMVEFPDDIYKALKVEAEKFAQTPAEWVAERLPAKPRKLAGNAKARKKNPSRPKTMADLFEGYIGGIKHGRSTHSSENCGEQFTDYLVAKWKAGHL
jgi:hypothetical protein